MWSLLTNKYILQVDKVSVHKTVYHIGIIAASRSIEFLWIVFYFLFIQKNVLMY